MNRKEFLGSCAAGLCACTGAALIPASSLRAAETAGADDWRLPFVQKRYGKLLEILSEQMDEETLAQVMRELGTYCSTTGDQWIGKFRDDFDGFSKSIKNGVSGDEVTYDREKGVITMTSPERTDCFCPLNSRAHTPSLVCDCSLGWQQHTWETFLGRKVRVELKEAVLRGGKRCVFEIHVL
jgi:hypothetical protein